MAISAGLLLLSYLASYVNPAKAWFMTIFGLLYAPLLILNTFLLVWALFRRSRSFLIPLIAIAPSIFIIGKYHKTVFHKNPARSLYKLYLALLSAFVFI